MVTPAAQNVGVDHPGRADSTSACWISSATLRVVDRLVLEQLFGDLVEAAPVAGQQAERRAAPGMQDATDLGASQPGRSTLYLRSTSHEVLTEEDLLLDCARPSA